MFGARHAWGSGCDEPVMLIVVLVVVLMVVVVPAICGCQVGSTQCVQEATQGGRLHAAARDLVAGLAHTYTFVPARALAHQRSATPPHTAQNVPIHTDDFVSDVYFLRPVDFSSVDFSSDAPSFYFLFFFFFFSLHI